MRMSGALTSIVASVPADQAGGIFHHDNVIFFQHRHQDVLKLLLPEFPFVEPGFHRLARRQVRKAAHEEEAVRIFHRKKWSKDFHSDFIMRRNRFLSEYLQKLRAPARLGSISPHLDDHRASPSSSLDQVQL